MEILGASTQYNDMIGHVALDFHESLSGLHDLARRVGMPETHWPIALAAEPLPGNFDGAKESGMAVTVFAAQRGVVGRTMEEVVAYARQHGAIETSRFRGRLSFDEWFGFVKRFDMKLTPKGVIAQTEITVRPTEE